MSPSASTAVWSSSPASEDLLHRVHQSINFPICGLHKITDELYSFFSGTFRSNRDQLKGKTLTSSLIKTGEACNNLKKDSLLDRKNANSTEPASERLKKPSKTPQSLSEKLYNAN